MEGEKLNRKGENVKCGNGIGQMLFPPFRFHFIFHLKMKVLPPSVAHFHYCSLLDIHLKMKVLPPGCSMDIAPTSWIFT